MEQHDGAKEKITTTPKSHTGIHPFIADLPIFEDKVKEFAETMGEVGLMHSITLDTEGNIIGGRHRLAACELAGIDPHYEVWEGDPLAFMLHDNDARKHQTTGQLAAERALTLDRAGHRQDNGRWKRGTAVLTEVDTSTSGSIAWPKRLAEAGAILDVLGRDALMRIAEGESDLKTVYEQARRQKDERDKAEARKVEAERQAEQREQRAKEFFDSDPDAQAWLDAKPAGTFGNMRAAFAAIQEEREEIRQAEQARREAEEAERREHQELIERHARYLEAFVSNFQTGLDMAGYLAPLRDEILDKCDPKTRSRFLEIENTYLKGHQP